MIDTVTIDLLNIIVPKSLPLFQSARTDYGIKQWFKPEWYRTSRVRYMPAVTIYHNKDEQEVWRTRVRIRVSLPKLMYCSNYYGIDETDFDATVIELAKRLQAVGLAINRQQIETAILKEVAFCYNFFLPSEFPYPIEYLKKMSFLGIGKTGRNIRNTEYQENTAGYNGKIYNGWVAVGLYDKKSELINNAKTMEEQEIVNAIQTGELPDNILRFEVTWQHISAVKQKLSTLIGGNTTQERRLLEVFNNKLAQTVLTTAFNKLTDEVNVKALEMPLLPIEQAVIDGREAGMSQIEIEAWLGRSYIMQQVGAVEYMKIQDRHFPRQRRAETQKRYQKILQKHVLPKRELEQIFEECNKQLQAFVIKKPETAPCVTELSFVTNIV